jgi:antitoxin component YwqK of YwqJK toxin-antitoxin module
LEAEEEYRDGLLSGGKRAWHRPGVLEQEAECAQGVFHGRVRQWHESGLPATDEVYEYGIRLRGQAWDESGNLVEEYTLSESDPDFDILQAFRRGEAEPGAAADGGGM